MSLLHCTHLRLAYQNAPTLIPHHVSTAPNCSAPHYLAQEQLRTNKIWYFSTCFICALYNLAPVTNRHQVHKGFGNDCCKNSEFTGLALPKLRKRICLCCTKSSYLSHSKTEMNLYCNKISDFSRSKTEMKLYCTKSSDFSHTEIRSKKVV